MALQNRLHLQMAMRSVEAPPSRLLYSLLMTNGWWDVSVLLCQEWDVAHFLFLLRNNTRFHMAAMVNLTRWSSSSSPSPSDPSAKLEQQQMLTRQLEALREPAAAAPMAAVTFGCDLREVRRLWSLAARMALPEFHWVLGERQNVAELRTEGLPLGLLAHGLMGAPSLDHYVQDAVELLARAVGRASLEDPGLALLPGSTNCLDSAPSNGSSGEYLAR